MNIDLQTVLSAAEYPSKFNFECCILQPFFPTSMNLTTPSCELVSIKPEPEFAHQIHTLLETKFSANMAYSHKNKLDNMHLFARFLFFITFIGFVPTLLASEDLSQALQDCLNIEQESERIHCYDSLANNEIKSKDSTTDSSNIDQSLPDNIGGRKFIGDSEPEKIKYRAHITSCKQASDNRWFYFFENGQVWKQVDRRKRRHKKCDFYVNVSKDGFGWIMELEETGKIVRISRKK